MQFLETTSSGRVAEALPLEGGLAACEASFWNPLLPLPSTPDPRLARPPTIHADNAFQESEHYSE